MERSMLLRQAIEHAGITQADVAKLLSEATGDRTDPRTVRHWLRGDRRCPGWVFYVLDRELAENPSNTPLKGFKNK